MSRSNLAIPWKRRASLRGLLARCGITAAILLAAFAHLNVEAQAEYEIADDSTVMARMLATPANGPEVGRVVAMFLLSGRREESQLLGRHVERGLIAQVLGEPPPVGRTVADALAFERGNAEPVDTLVERALATLTAEAVESVGDEPILGFGVAPNAPRRYEGHSIWRVEQGIWDGIYLRIDVTNRSALAVSRFSGSAVLVASDGHRFGPLECVSLVPLGAAETRAVFCQMLVKQGAPTDLPGFASAAVGGEARLEFSATLAAYPALGDLQVYPHMQAPGGSGYEAKKALDATTCSERGSCASDIGGALGPAAPWIGIGMLLFGGFALLVGRRLAYRDSSRFRFASYAASTAAWVIGGAALGIVIARSAAPSYHLGWLPVLSGAGLGFALASPANAAPLVLCAAACELALIALFRSFGSGGYGGLAIAAITGIAGAILAAPSLLVAVVLGLRMLADANLSTRLNKLAVIAGFAAPLIVVAYLFTL